MKGRSLEQLNKGRMEDTRILIEQILEKLAPFMFTILLLCFFLFFFHLCGLVGGGGCLYGKMFKMKIFQ